MIKGPRASVCVARRRSGGSCAIVTSWVRCIYVRGRFVRDGRVHPEVVSVCLFLQCAWFASQVSLRMNVVAHIPLRVLTRVFRVDLRYWFSVFVIVRAETH